jgi:hypothetical protein
MSGFDFSVLAKLPSNNTISSPEPPQSREDNFRVKVAMQQFMNHNGPLFRAFAFKGLSVRDVVEGDVLLEPAEAAASLTKYVAAAVAENLKLELTAREFSFFRTEAANWVAERWANDQDYDVERAAKVIGATVARAGKDWDFDPFKDDRVSPDASLMMSAAGVATKLMEQVEIYDFRLGVKEVLKKLLDCVIRTAIDAASDMLPTTASKADMINLVQTVSRNLANIMEGVYERKAREVVAYLADKPADEKVKWLQANKPVDDVILEFKDWAMCFVGFAIATSNQIKAVKNDQSPERKI